MIVHEARSASQERGVFHFIYMISYIVNIFLWEMGGFLHHSVDKQIEEVVKIVSSSFSCGEKY